jgi:hypothetical protein
VVGSSRSPEPRASRSRPDQTISRRDLRESEIAADHGMNCRTVPSRQREFQENRLSVSTITVGVTCFFPDERNRENHLKEHNSLVKSGEEQSAIFFQRFLRNYRLLDFIACRVLGDEERAPIAVHNCWRTASRNPPHFEYEGAFRKLAG